MNDARMTELTDWWMDHAADEAQMVIPKAIAYGADDLLQIGRQMAGAINRDVTDAQAAELGIAFYAMGKIARIMAAVKEGRDPNIDSWLDLGVYAKMAQRVRITGGWPGNDNIGGDTAA
jgi:hypothetical protein